MQETTPIRHLQRTCRIWSRRHESQIVIRVYYDISESAGCQIYSIRQMEESNTGEP